MTTTRKAVPLSDEEVEAVNFFRGNGVLSDLAGAAAARSEPAALHALVLIGLGQVREHAQAQGYAALAQAQDEEDRQFARAVRSRRRGDEQ